MFSWIASDGKAHFSEADREGTKIDYFNAPHLCVCRAIPSDGAYRLENSVWLEESILWSDLEFDAPLVESVPGVDDSETGTEHSHGECYAILQIVCKHWIAPSIPPGWGSSPRKRLRHLHQIAQARARG